jgi:hypothetical protein
MVERLYKEVDRRLWRAADRVVQTHLRKLQDEGRINSSAGTPKPFSDADAAREAEEERRRQAVIAQADEYRAHAARQALMLQEAPPTAQWLEPPLYELAR